MRFYASRVALLGVSILIVASACTPSGLKQEIQDLKTRVSELEQEKQALCKQVSELEQEKQALCKQVSELEQGKQDLNNKLYEKQKETEDKDQQLKQVQQKKLIYEENSKKNERKIRWLWISIWGVFGLIVVGLISLLVSPGKRLNVNGDDDGLHCPRCGWKYAPGEKVCKNCKTRF